jgi:hypothetical protein
LEGFSESEWAGVHAEEKPHTSSDRTMLDLDEPIRLQDGRALVYIMASLPIFPVSSATGVARYVLFSFYCCFQKPIY